MGKEWFGMKFRLAILRAPRMQLPHNAERALPRALVPFMFKADNLMVGNPI